MMILHGVLHDGQTKAGAAGLYLTDKDDMANLFAAIYALKKITWFKASVRDIRAFKVENWSDFTQIVKEDD